MRLRLPIAAAVVVALVVATLFAGTYAHWIREAKLDAAYLPPAREPPPGPRAPTAAAFGAVVGSSSVAEVKALVARLGLDCPDTSVRALMAQVRQAKRQEIADARRRGLSVDAVAGASILRGRSPMEHNPQVRLRCEPVSSQVLTDRARAPSSGQLLYVFDSAELPLRHASFQRSFPPAETATAEREVEAAVANARRIYGAPTKVPTTKGLPWLSPVEHVWSFADLVVKVTAMNFGARGITLSEVVEVPLPLRADAPVIAAKPAR